MIKQCYDFTLITHYSNKTITYKIKLYMKYLICMTKMIYIFGWLVGCVLTSHG